MGVVYGLYSTRDAAVRYVGQTEYTSSKSLDVTITKALDRESGPLYDWVRDEWRAGFEVGAYTLQDEIIPADLEMFERYWIEQFAGLLNAAAPAVSSVPTEAGYRVNAAIRSLLKGQSETPGRQ